MFSKISTFVLSILASAALAACGLVPTPVPSATPIPASSTPVPPSPTSTLIPTSVPTPTITPTSTAEGALGGVEYLYFTSMRDGNYEIYRMRTDGSEQTRLTDCEVHDLNPSVAPDGSAIFYRHYMPDADPQTLEYRWMTLDGSKDEGFGSPGIDKVSWAPDGQYVALTGVVEGGNVDIIRLRSDGSGFVRLTDDSEIDQHPAWSPDGETIAYTHFMLGMGYIYLMDASDGGNQRRLVQEIPGLNPTWSPDGKYIAFWSMDGSSTQIYVVDSDGKNLRKITDDAGYHENPAWSPDGKWIAYWSDESGDREIYIIHPDGSGKTNLTNTPGMDEGPEWSNW